jgi:hypothetical protein
VIELVVLGGCTDLLFRPRDCQRPRRRAQVVGGGNKAVVVTPRPRHDPEPFGPSALPVLEGRLDVADRLSVPVDYFPAHERPAADQETTR